MKLIILDRDGVINEDSDNFIRSVQEWIPIPGSLPAIARLNSLGYTVAVATNQSGIARGYFDTAALEAMHDYMRGQLAVLGGRIDALEYCPHGPDDGCDCRKPRPGMLMNIARQFGVPPARILTVGDSLRDYQAAQAAGMRYAQVRTGKGLRTLASGELPATVPVFGNLAELVEQLAGAAA